MNTEVKQSGRQYASPLRAEQADQTRSRILAAFAEQVVDSGLRDFSIERVARRAGVSPRTVYHHFPRRDDLLDAINSWIDTRFSAEAITAPVKGEEFARRLERLFQRFDENETLVRAQLVTQLGQTLRERGRSRRRPIIEEIVREAVPRLNPDDVRRAAAVIHYLASSEAWRALKDEWGLEGREAGEAVAWAVRALLKELRQTRSRRTNEKGEDDANR